MAKDKLAEYEQEFRAKPMPDIRAGDVVRVVQKVKEGGKTKPQNFEGLVIARKHGKGPSATITVRKISFGVGVERVFPVHSPTIEKIDILKRTKVRRAKLYYVREQVGKKVKRRKELPVPTFGEVAPEIQAQEEEIVETKEEAMEGKAEGVPAQKEESRG